MPSGLQTSPQGRKLWKWLTGPEGFAMYSGSPHPWTTLRDFLIAHGVSPAQADGEATNIMQATPAGRVLFRMHHGKGHGDGKTPGEKVAARFKGGK